MIIRWIINALALLLVAYVVPEFIVENFYIALITALVLGLVNAVIRPLLLILTLPINILTLGLFTFVVNALMIWFVASFIQGFDVTFAAALMGAVLLWVISLVVNLALPPSR